MSTELWYTEKQTNCHGITTKVVRGLHHEETEFQTIDIFKTEQFGNLLSLDGMVMTTDADEFVYHEMITHVAMNTHPNPREVLVVGGGDGGVIREVLRHKTVKRAVMAEIDRRVIELSAEYFPQIAKGLTDDRVDIQVGDGFAHVANQRNAYDVIIVDSTEPTGAAVPLFNREFYEGVRGALKDDGIMVAQTDTPWFKGELVRRLFADIASVFPITRLYTAAIPTYPSGLWSFTIGSTKYDPLDLIESEPLETRYYNSAVHQSAFMLPNFVRELTQVSKYDI